MSTNANHDGEEIDDGSISEDFRKFPIGQNRLNETGVNLNEKQCAAIEMLAIGKSLSAVARILEVDPRTLYNWRKTDAFREALSSRRRELWSIAIDRVRGMVNPSLDIIEHHLSDRYERVRFRAAQTVLNLASIKKHASEAGEPAESGELSDMENGKW